MPAPRFTVTVEGDDVVSGRNHDRRSPVSSTAIPARADPSLVSEAIGLKKRITPRAMRRTFQDLARNADIETIVRRKICGHATHEMSDLYSTVPQREIQAAVGAVISLAKYRELLRDGAKWWERRKKRNGHPGKPPKWPFFCGR